MKLLTYSENNNPSPRFGFKSGNRIVDIRNSAQWISDNQNNDHFLTVPKTLKESLVNWNQNYSILKQLELSLIHI